MTVLRLAILIWLAALTASCHRNSRQQLSKTPNGCPVTVRPSVPFVPPSPFPSDLGGADAFWFGSEKLWTALPTSGVDHLTETEKIGWGSVDYDFHKEPYPDL